MLGGTGLLGGAAGTGLGGSTAGGGLLGAGSGAGAGLLGGQMPATGGLLGGTGLAPASGGLLGGGLGQQSTGLATSGGLLGGGLGTSGGLLGGGLGTSGGLLGGGQQSGGLLGGQRAGGLLGGQTGGLLGGGQATGGLLGGQGGGLLGGAQTAQHQQLAAAQQLLAGISTSTRVSELPQPLQAKFSRLHADVHVQRSVMEAGIDDNGAAAQRAAALADLRRRLTQLQEQLRDVRQSVKLTSHATLTAQSGVEKAAAQVRRVSDGLTPTHTPPLEFTRQWSQQAEERLHTLKSTLQSVEQQLAQPAVALTPELLIQLLQALRSALMTVAGKQVAPLKDATTRVREMMQRITGRDVFAAHSRKQHESDLRRRDALQESLLRTGAAAAAQAPAASAALGSAAAGAVPASAGLLGGTAAAPAGTGLLGGGASTGLLGGAGLQAAAPVATTGLLGTQAGAASSGLLSTPAATAPSLASAPASTGILGSLATPAPIVSTSVSTAQPSLLGGSAANVPTTPGTGLASPTPGGMLGGFPTAGSPPAPRARDSGKRSRA